MVYEVWVWGDRKLEQYQYPSISKEILFNLAKNRADVVSTNGEVKITVWSDHYVEPIWEDSFSFSAPRQIIGGC